MTNGDKILSTLKTFQHGLCDDCISKIAHISPRQTVNHFCRGLCNSGLIARNQDGCAECGQYKLVNRISADVPARPASPAGPSRSWPWEGYVQEIVAALLIDAGFVVRTANTATREHGKDIDARGSDGRRLWVTVKGYPEKSADQQARHWFAEVVYDLVRYGTEDRGVSLGVGLPDHRTYKVLALRVEWLKTQLPFKFYWVSQDGSVRVE